MLVIGLWPVFALLTRSFQWKKVRPFLFSFLIAALYFAISRLTMLYAPDIGRHLYNLLGVLTLAFCISIFYWLAYGVLSLFKRQSLLVGSRWAWGFIVLVCGFSVLAIYNYNKPIAVEKFTLSSDKISQPYRFVQVTDIQYGTTTKQEMDDILDTTYAQNPDFIVFTGDLIDFNHYEFEDFKKLAASPVPVFFIRGNHEFYHHPEKLLAYLKKLGPLEVLINRSTTFGELQIIGLDFSREENNVANQLSNIEIETDKYSILLDHAPKDVEVAVEHNIDLLLYGHIHGGQMWPYTWVVDMMYKYPNGAYELNNSFIYTSDGASLWGPRMRLGSQNEIAVFNLLPEKPLANK